MGPEVGSTVQWQEGGDARAPLVASVLEQFGRMTALARETTSSLLTSTAYWGAQPGHLTASLLPGLNRQGIKVLRKTQTEAGTRDYRHCPLLLPLRFESFS